MNELVFGAGRIAALVGGVAGLSGAIAGGMALARAARRGGVLAVVLGAFGLLLGGLVVVTADGGVGTGNGVGGGIVAIVVGGAGMLLGALALARSRRTASR